MIALSYGIRIWKKIWKISLDRKDFAHLTVAPMWVLWKLMEILCFVTGITVILLSVLLFSFHCMCLSGAVFNFWDQFLKLHGKAFKSTFIWMFANIFNKVIQKNNARYISQKLESLFLLCTWGILHIGLWLTHHTVYAGWGTCGVQCEGGKTQCMQVQILNKHSVKLAWILRIFMDSGKYMECC